MNLFIAIFILLVYFTFSTPCTEELNGDADDGRYYQLIQSAFQEGTIRYKRPNRNIYCRCIADRWMTCSIYLKPSSKEYEIVDRKLDDDNVAAAWPFQLYNIPNFPPVFIYTYPFRQPTVYAQMRLEIMPPNWPEEDAPTPAEQLRGRTQSSMAAFHYPERVIPLNLCTDGKPDVGCPITTTEFDVGQYVYILKEDISKVEDEKKCVPCISAQGLRKLASTPESRLRGGFKDLFRRRDEARLTIENNYEAFIIGPSIPDVRSLEGTSGEQNIAMTFHSGNFEFSFWLFAFMILVILICNYVISKYLNPAQNEYTTFDIEF